MTKQQKQGQAVTTPDSMTTPAALPPVRVKAVVGPAPCPFCDFDDCYLSERDECIVCPACGAKGPTDWKRFGDTELIPLEMWERRANTTEHRQGARQGGSNE